MNKDVMNSNVLNDEDLDFVTGGLEHPGVVPFDNFEPEPFTPISRDYLSAGKQTGKQLTGFKLEDS